jgi:hypothetical protein
MFKESVWNSLSLNINVTAKEEYGTKRSSIKMVTVAPLFISDISLSVSGGTVILNLNEIENLRDNLTFLLENTKPDK